MLILCGIVVSNEGPTPYDTNHLISYYSKTPVGRRIAWDRSFRCIWALILLFNWRFRILQGFYCIVHQFKVEGVIRCPYRYFIETFFKVFYYFHVPMWENSIQEKCSS